MKAYILISSILICFVVSGLIAAQNSKSANINNASANTGGPIPDYLVYRYFLGHLDHLEKKAEELVRKGQKGDEFQDYYKKKLLLTETEAMKLKQIAKSLDAQLKTQDAKAKDFIAKDRAKFPNGKLPSRDALPKVPQELLKMQQDRDALIQQSVSQCKSSLSKASSDRVDKFLAEEFVKNIKVQGVDIPRTHNPQKQTPAPFLQIK